MDNDNVEQKAALPDDTSAFRELQLRTKALLQHVCDAPPRRKWTQRRDALQAQYLAAKQSVPKNRQLVATLGIDMSALKDESVTLALSEEDFRSLYESTEP